MSKRLILILALAFMAAFAFAAYAEVQNVKVSGDITMSGVYRNNFDFTKSVNAGSNNASNYNDQETDLLSITRVRVDADLTDNVSATVRLLNERNWNGESTTTVGANKNINMATDTTTGGANSEDKVSVDLAYVTLKEFLYSPLTLTVGRQELHFGNDWLIGDPDTNGIALRSSLAEGDLSARKAFDAIRATLNYDPLVVDVLYAKVAEKTPTLDDDITLMGLNANYALNKDTTLEGFYFGKIKGASNNLAVTTSVTNIDAASAAVYTTSTLAGGNPSVNKADTVHTIGGRVVNKTVKNLTVDVAAAYQFGTYNPRFDPNARYISASQKAETAPRSAWGLEAIGTYDLKDISMISKYSPSVTGAYVYLSGESRDRTGGATYRGWDAMFENQTFGHIINATLGFSNASIVGLSLKAKPMEDITVKLDGVGLWFNKKFTENRLDILSGVDTARQFRMRNKSFAGQEYDLTVSYDYTEDVQFSLLGGVFLPSKAINGNLAVNNDGTYNNKNRTPATELIGTMKVTF